MTARSRFRTWLSLGLLLLAALPARAQTETCGSAVPANIDAGQLAPKIVDMLMRSATFRRQCRRIAATRLLRIKLGITPQPMTNYRALTVLERYEAGALRADVRLVFGEDYVEMLGHEFEHVLEQVDGINLRSEVSHGEAQVLIDGSYETRRARKAGLQVLREYQTLEAISPTVCAVASER